MRAAQFAFSAGEVSPEIAARMDVAKYGSALRTAYNVVGLREGGMRNRPGMQFVGQSRNSTGYIRLIPFQFSAEQAYALEFAYQKFRVMLNGEYVTETPKPILGIASPLILNITGHGWQVSQHIYLSGIGGVLDGDGLSALNGRTFRVQSIPDANHVALFKMDGHAIDIADYSGAPVLTSATAAGIYELNTPYTDDDLAGIRYEQSADVMYLAHPSYPLQKLSRTGPAAWNIHAVDFYAHVKPAENIGGSATTGPGTASPINHVYKVAGFNDVTGQESLISSGVATISNDLTLVGSYNTITWTAPGAATGFDLPTRYIVYKASNGLYGYIGSTDGLSFKDNNIDPDLGATPQLTSDPLSGANNYPDALGFYEQRLFLAGPNSKPNGVWGSRSGDFENLNYSRPLRADDGLSFGISARQVNRVLHLVPMSDLLAFTSESVFRIAGTGTDAIGPSSITVKPQVHRGSSATRPLVIDETVLYVTAKGSKLRNVGYQFASDTWQGTDLTILSSHLFKGRTIKELAWVEHPHSAVFCVLDNGHLLCLTWMPEQEVAAWSVVETGSAADDDGRVETICAVTENGVDSLYLGVRRARGNGHFRFIERLALPFETGDAIEGAVYLDSSVSYSGDPADMFSGLEHLEGRTVSALADGNVVTGLVVTDGKVTLPDNASQVAVGIPYVSTLKTLPVVVPQTAGRRQAVARAIVRLLDTRGIKVGVNPARLEPPRPRLNAGWAEPSDLISGDVEVAFDAQWSSDLGVIVQQSDPLPMTVLGVYPDVQVGG